MEHLQRRNLALVLGCVGVTTAMVAALALAWWSTGEGGLFKVSLRLLGVEVCFGPVCEAQGYGALPAEAYSRDPTPFVLLGRVALGAAAAGAACLAVGFVFAFTGRDRGGQVAPERLGAALFAAAIAAAVGFVAIRPDVSLGMDGGTGAPPPDEMTGAFMGALVPELGLSLGLPLFVTGCALAMAAARAIAR